MKEEINTALAELINTTVEAKDFVKAELPETVDQILTWGLWSNIYSIVFFLLAISFFIGLSYGFNFKLKKWGEVNDQDDLWFELNFWNTCLCISLTFLVCFSIAGLLEFYTNIKEIIQILIAPRTWLIEYVDRLM